MWGSSLQASQALYVHPIQLPTEEYGAVKNVEYGFSLFSGPSALRSTSEMTEKTRGTTKALGPSNLCHSGLIHTKPQILATL